MLIFIWALRRNINMTTTEYRPRCAGHCASQPCPSPWSCDAAGLITKPGAAHIDTDCELANDWQDMVLNVIAWGCLIVFLLIAGGLALGFASVKFGWTF